MKKEHIKQMIKISTKHNLYFQTTMCSVLCFADMCLNHRAYSRVHNCPHRPKKPCPNPYCVTMIRRLKFQFLVLSVCTHNLMCLSDIYFRNITMYVCRTRSTLRVSVDYIHIMCIGTRERISQIM